MIQLAYTSLASKALSKSQLLLLLQQARVFNAEKNITGVLLYKDLSFFQVIEGDDTTILNLMRSISNDKRHFNITTLYTRPIESRNFNLWSMGYINLENSEADLHGFEVPEFEFPLQNLNGNLRELVNIAKAKQLVLQFSSRQVESELKQSSIGQ